MSCFFFFKQKTAYEMRISDWSSDVCSSDLRTTLEEYRKDEPKWETLLDLDALNKAEGENWVWHGDDCLRPDYERCLVALSRGGADADVTSKFDLTTKQWLEGGSQRPEAKGSLGDQQSTEKGKGGNGRVDL